MADPAQGSCRFASHRERSLHPRVPTSDAPLAVPPVPSSFPLSRRDILRNADDIQELRAQKVEAVKFFLRRTPRRRPPCVIPPPHSPFGAIFPRRHVSVAFYVHVRACFIFIHRRVLISPPPWRTRSAHEHRMGDK